MAYNERASEGLAGSNIPCANERPKATASSIAVVIVPRRMNLMQSLAVADLIRRFQGAGPSQPLQGTPKQNQRFCAANQSGPKKQRQQSPND
jgi:hypothetical protein